VSEIFAALCQRIKIRRMGRTIATVRAEEVPAELVGQIKNDVRLLLRGLRLFFGMTFGLYAIRQGGGYSGMRGGGGCTEKEITPIDGQNRLLL
jgi:hypothetical protein